MKDRAGGSCPSSHTCIRHSENADNRTTLVSSSERTAYIEYSNILLKRGNEEREEEGSTQGREPAAVGFLRSPVGMAHV